MSTRHVSSQNDYPFVSVLSPSDSQVVGGILEIFLVIQGEHDGEGSSSEQEISYASMQSVHLVSYSAGPTETQFVFQARHPLGKYWDIVFDVPNANSGYDIGQVNNSNVSDCQGVLVYSASDIISSGSGGVYIKVEPGRSQWHVEFVKSIQFLNSPECVGEQELEILNVSSAGNSELNWSDGYNNAVSFSSDQLSLSGGISLGLGHTDLNNLPEEGCDEEIGSSSSEEYLDYVYTINGIVPRDGDIPLTTSNSLAIQRSVGRIEIIVRS